MDNCLKETKVLNYSNKEIVTLIETNKWHEQTDFYKIKNIYEFVQNDILFGYNSKDMICASKIIQEGIGQCNTKAIVLMTLLRGVGIPCQLHGFYVTKDFQRGVTTFLINKLAPKYIVHTWVEVYYQEQWFTLEGVILDKAYIQAVQNKYYNHQGLFKKYAISTKDLSNPNIDWNQNDTFIQKESIVQDLGVFISPDDFFSQYPQDLSIIKAWLYSHIGCHMMNANVKKIRKTKR